MNQHPNLSNLADANVQNFSALLKELSSTFAEANQNWLARAKTEGEFGSELVAKLAAARSMPEVATLYQEWLGHRMQRLAEDGQRFAADTQKLTSAWAKLFSLGEPNRDS